MVTWRRVYESPFGRVTGYHDTCWYEHPDGTLVEVRRWFRHSKTARLGRSDVVKHYTVQGPFADVFLCRTLKDAMEVAAMVARGDTATLIPIHHKGGSKGCRPQHKE